MIDRRGFVLSHTARATAPLVPEIALHLADAVTPLWEATEAFLERTGLAPPFWAFAWPGSQALARYVLDTPALVRGRRVLDFAAGCGLAALAAAKAGAAAVDACDIDPFAVAAIGLNAEANGLALAATADDLVGTAPRWDVVLCGDVCYEAPMTRHVLPWLRRLAAEGVAVLIADPGRDYLPDTGLDPFGPVFDVPVSRDLEDRDVRRCRLYRVSAG